MTLPHPSDVILSGRIRVRSSTVGTTMLKQFLELPADARIEFLFWSLQDMAAHNQRLVTQVNQLIKMLDQAKAQG
jgi:hypothetical protein